MRHLALLAALLSLLPAPGAAAQLRYSGALRDSSGRALDGSYLLRFTIPGEGNKDAWSESRYVKSEGGRFSTVLGTRRPLPESAARGRVLVEPPPGTGWSVLSADAPEAPPVVPAASPVVPAAPVAAVPAAAPSAEAAADLDRLERELDQARREREESKRRLEALERAVTAPPAAAPAAARLYVVQAGETLRTVAKKTLGDERHWVLIYQANSDRIQRAGELTAGQKLVIPAGPR